MSIKIIRGKETTDYVQNTDDARILRYAVSGFNGVTSGYANECGYEEIGNVFKVKSGEIVKDGWQAKIDSNGVSLTLLNSGTRLYYTIYCKYDFSVTGVYTATIESLYDTSDYPNIPTSDDLTENENGIAYQALYHVSILNGVIDAREAIFDLIEIGNSKNSQNDFDGNEIKTTYVKKSDFDNSNETKFGDYIVQKQIELVSSDISSTPLAIDAQSIRISTGITPSDGECFKIFGYVPYLSGVTTYKNPFVFELYYRTTYLPFGGNNGVLIPIEVVSTDFSHQLFTWRKVGTRLQSNGDLYFFIAEKGTPNNDSAKFKTGAYIVITKILKII